MLCPCGTKSSNGAQHFALGEHDGDAVSVSVSASASASAPSVASRHFSLAADGDAGSTTTPQCDACSTSTAKVSN